MDLSKLPRLSKTPSVPTDAAPSADGAPAAQPVAEPGRRGAFCDQCGASLRGGARFCDSCGRPVGMAARAGPQGVVPDYASPSDSPGGLAIDVWFSMVLGLVFLLLGRGYISDLRHPLPPLSTATGFEWAKGHPKAGQEIPPDELTPENRKKYDAQVEADKQQREGEKQQRLTTASLFFFGVALLIDAAVRLVAWLAVPGRRLVLVFGILVMLFALGYNLYTSVQYMKAGLTPLLSLICIAFGGYVLFVQWFTLRTLPAKT